RGEPQAALAWYARALDTLTKYMAEHPADAKVHPFLAGAHAGRAETLDRLNRRDEALQDWDRVIVLSEADQPGLWRCFRLLPAGEPAKAVALADEAAGSKNQDGETLYLLARVCALASASVKGDPSRQEQYGARAIALLRQSATRGHE